MKTFSKVKKVTALLLLMGCLLATLAGCGKEKTASDTSLVASASVLIEKSYVINQLFFEEGIALLENGKVENRYQEADASQLAQYGFSSFDSISQYVKSIYSDVAYAQWTSLAIDRQSDGVSILRQAYCYDAKDKHGTFLMLMVSLDGLNNPTDKTVYDLSSLQVVSKTATTAILEVEASIKDESGKVQTRTKQFGLVLENG